MDGSFLRLQARGIEPPFSFQGIEKKTAVHGQKKRCCAGKMAFAILRQYGGLSNRHGGKPQNSAGCAIPWYLRNHTAASREFGYKTVVVNEFAVLLFPRSSLRLALAGTNTGVAAAEIEATQIDKHL